MATKVTEAIKLVHKIDVVGDHLSTPKNLVTNQEPP